MLGWQQIKFVINSSLVEYWSDFLESGGAVSVTYRDFADTPVLEPLPGETPLWDDLGITGLFKDDLDLLDLLSYIRSNIDLPNSLLLEKLPDEDWERSWMSYFKPMQFGNKIWIIPDGFEVVDETACNILLDPGLAFGTGTHPTTALCLEWLDNNSPDGLAVIDYGCGSGVLSVAASLLGAVSVIATDIDAQALLATNDNANKNNVDNIVTKLSSKEMVIEPVDLLIANILAKPLISLSASFASKVKAFGVVVLSGMLSTQWQEVSDCYSEWFEMDPPILKDGWVCLSGKRKP